MKSVQAFLGLIGLAAALGWVASAAALPPIGKEIKVNPAIKGAADTENSLKSGMRVIVNLKDKNRVIGTLVWADQTGDYLLVRPTTGAAPRKILGKDIAGIDRIRMVAAGGGAVKDEPEIFQVSIINGDLKTVAYHAPNLSPGEKSQLSELESTENEFARTQHMRALVLQSLMEEIQVLQLQRAQLEQNNLRMEINNTYTSWAGAYNPYRGYIGTSPYYFQYGITGSGYGGLGGLSGSSVSSNTQNIVTKEIALGKQLAEARRSLARARGHGLYENGNLVAVMPDAAPAIRPVADEAQ